MKRNVFIYGEHEAEILEEYSDGAIVRELDDVYSEKDLAVFLGYTEDDVEKYPIFCHLSSSSEF